MSVTIEAIVNNQSYALSGGDPWWFVSLTGGGIPPIRRIKERSPLQHGSTDVGFLLDERMINLVLLLEAQGATTQAALELADDYREEFVDHIKPLDDIPINLRITQDSGRVRQVDANVVGPVDLPITLRERMGPSQLVVVQFECADPIPYDPTLQNIVFDTSAGSGFLIPMEVPFLYTTGTTINRVTSLEYEGKWETFPVIYATGPAEDLVITNETTGRVLDFTGHVIAGGDTYTIDTRYGRRRIIDQNGVIKNSALTDDSDLQNFGILPNPKAPGGINDIRVEVAAQATIATRVRFEFYNRYLSFS